MSRRPYIALAWGLRDGCAGRMRELGERLVADGWRPCAKTDRVGFWAQAGKDLPVTRLTNGWGLLLGDVHAMPGCGAAVVPDVGAWRSPVDGARWLARNLWGPFIGVLHAPGGAVHIYRDPGGALGCVTWTLGDGLDVVASDLAETPSWLQPRRLSLNWDRIAAVAAVPTAVTTEPLFDDMQGIGPGALHALGVPDTPAQAIWSPDAFAARPIEDLPEVRTEVVRRVDAVVEALIGGHERVIMELSGGLDSSILAASLGATGLGGRVTHWLNYRDPRPEADESGFARAVTDRLGVALHIAPKDLVPLDEAAFKEIGRFSRPAIGGVDAVRDRFETELLRQAGATGIVSGQGGDGIFFQFPNAMIAADEFARRGVSAWRSPVLAAVARRRRQSVWSVIRQIRAAATGREERPMVASALLTPPWGAAASGLEHEWVKAARARGLPPGKVLHIQGTALTHFYYEPSRRLEVADILMPLFSQPVMELCLAIPVPDLAGASYDRPFARETFASRLPPCVVERRAKGNVSAYVARLVAASCDTLRPYLIEGCLAEAGVLDRAKLRHTLDPENLMTGQAQFAGHVLNAAAVEAWVRHWQGRVPDSPQAGRWRP